MLCCWWFSILFPFRYTNLLERSDFIINILPTLPMAEFCSSLILLESQTQLLSELKYAQVFRFSYFFWFSGIFSLFPQNIGNYWKYRKEPIYSQGLEDAIYFNEDEFLEEYENWKKTNEEITSLFSNPQYVAEFEVYKTSLLPFLGDIKKFSEKLWGIQKSLMQYHRFCEILKTFKDKVHQFFFKEFALHVEIDCDDSSF